MWYEFAIRMTCVVYQLPFAVLVGGEWQRIKCFPSFPWWSLRNLEYKSISISGRVSLLNMPSACGVADIQAKPGKGYRVKGEQTIRHTFTWLYIMKSVSGFNDSRRKKLWKLHSASNCITQRVDSIAQMRIWRRGSNNSRRYPRHRIDHHQTTGISLKLIIINVAVVESALSHDASQPERF